MEMVTQIDIFEAIALEKEGKKGSFRVSVIHRTLTWTTGSLTCVRDHSDACVYTLRLGTLTASQRNIVDSQKTHKIVLCSLRGSNLGSWNPLDFFEADALSTEPSRHPRQKYDKSHLLADWFIFYSEKCWRRAVKHRRKDPAWSIRIRKGRNYKLVLLLMHICSQTFSQDHHNMWPYLPKWITWILSAILRFLTA